MMVTAKTPFNRKKPEAEHCSWGGGTHLPEADRVECWGEGLTVIGISNEAENYVSDDSCSYYG